MAGDLLHKAFSPEDIEPEAKDAVVAIVGRGEIVKEGLDGGGIRHQRRLR